LVISLNSFRLVQFVRQRRMRLWRKSWSRRSPAVRDPRFDRRSNRDLAAIR
jgi:hypothetical protein